MTDIQSLEQTLACEKVQKKIGSVIHPTLNIQKFCRSVIVAANDPKSAISQCERESLINALINCASDGLIPDGVDAAITPYYDKNKGYSVASYMPMIDGIIKHIKNDPDVARIVSECVYENDEFSYEVGTQEFIHRPHWFGERGDMIGVYAFVEKKDGTRFFQALNNADLLKIRGCSRSQKVWADWPQQMAKISAKRRLHRIFKIQGNIITRDDDLYTFEQKSEEDHKIIDINEELGLLSK